MITVIEKDNDIVIQACFALEIIAIKADKRDELIRVINTQDQKMVLQWIIDNMDSFRYPVKIEYIKY